jgi:hypothetical protein
MKDLERIDAQFGEIGELIAGGAEALAVRAPKVSGWSVGQQVDHMLNVAHGVFYRLTGDGEEVPHGINLSGRLLLGIGWLPRGVGKSPKSVLPGEVPIADELGARLARLRGDFQGLRFRTGLLASRRRLFKHPYFGGLDCAQTLRFLSVHTHHHLKIVRDIRRAAGARG